MIIIMGDVQLAGTARDQGLADIESLRDAL